jgi:hypothetical protein
MNADRAWRRRADLNTLGLAVLLLLMAFLFQQSFQQGNDIEDAGKQARTEIVDASAAAVGLGCRDVNVLRQEQRRTIIDGRPRLKALYKDGAITRGLYVVALRQGNIRLKRLADKDCTARVRNYRKSALK